MANSKKWLAIMAIWVFVLIAAMALLAWIRSPDGTIPPFVEVWQPVDESMLPFPLPSISFTKGDHRIPPDEYPKLNQFAGDLKQHQRYKVLIVGHTKYSSEQDRRIATDRADSVRKYLTISDAGEWILDTEGKSESSCRGVTFIVKQRK